MFGTPKIDPLKVIEEKIRDIQLNVLENKILKGLGTEQEYRLVDAMCTKYQIELDCVEVAPGERKLKRRELIKLCDSMATSAEKYLNSTTLETSK